MKPKLLVFTDLDGTLLDHHDYSWSAAEPSLRRLRAAGVPVIFNTSKTAAEVERLHREMGLGAPFIVENGSAVLGPAKCHESQPKTELLHHLGAKRSAVLAVLAQCRAEGAQFSGFNDWSCEQIVAHTGLSPAEAALSAQRDYSEPVLWEGDAAGRDDFVRTLQLAGLSALQGGRFLSVQGDCDKGRALQWLARYYRELWQCEVLTVALGDSQNDCAMLEAADIAVWIKSAKPFPSLNRTERVYHSELAGPVGWNHMMARILHDYEQGS